MATYRSIAATETDPQAPITSALMKALDANPTAIAEGAAGAPLAVGAWYPYGAVTQGDGATGLIWSNTIHGAVATVTTPDLEDGWDYAFDFQKVMGPTASTFRLGANLFRETSAAYAGVSFFTTSSPISSSVSMTGFFELPGARIARRGHFFQGQARYGATGDAVGGSASDPIPVGASHAVAQKILRVQFSLNSGNISGADGYIRMLKRRLTAP